MRDRPVYNVSRDAARWSYPQAENPPKPNVFTSLLTPSGLVRTLAALRKSRSEKGHETHIPAQQDQARTHARLPCPHGDQGRASCSEAPPRKRPRSADALASQTPVDTTSNNSGLTSTSGNRFTKDNRLLDAADFGRVFDAATRSRDKLFTVLCRENATDTARLGLAIAKKRCRRAAARNRIKRVVRESFRQQQELLSGLDIVVMNQPAAATADNAELFASLDRHWHRCSKVRT
jgi:ribonuclease P protein component